jgi:hypothetical protein
MMGGLFEFGLGGFGEVDCHYFGFRFMFMWVFPLLVCEQMCREGGVCSYYLWSKRSRGE